MISIPNEDIEEIIEWNLCYGITPQETIENLEKDGVTIPQEIKDQYSQVIH
jgi:hypothetical protein